ncbi:MAG: hypothetical protein O7C74_00925, partial [Acidobacteria bacterium]|nr:hypothetical protein [Acidobacteriota bacterium]
MACGRTLVAWRVAGNFLVAMALLWVSGCSGGDPDPLHSGVEVPHGGGDLDPVASLEARGGWILPPAGSQWTRSRMLAILLLPLESDPASLRVELNGRERTADFLPASLISKKWRERADEMRAGQSDGAGVGPETGSLRRVQAILDSRDMLPGDNLLQASFVGPDGQVIQQVLHFSFRPGGRTIRCLVSRVTRRGENTAAGARLLVTPLDGAAAVDLSPGSSHPLFPWPEPRRRSFIIARAGVAEFYLPEGRYRIVASGGLLDGLDIWETPLRGDAEHRFVVRRQVELPGTVAVDFHVHAAPSIDSVIPMMDQLAAFQAAGVDLLVASDHNIVTDYRPLIASLPAASGHIRSLPGVEVSLRAAAGDSYGHW